MRKHPSKVQIGEKRVSSSSVGLCRWNSWGFLAFGDMAESTISCIQKGKEKLT